MKAYYYEYSEGRYWVYVNGRCVGSAKYPDIALSIRKAYIK